MRRCHHSKPDELERQRDKRGASDGLGLGAMTGVDAVGGGKVGDRVGLRDVAGAGDGLVDGGRGGFVVDGGGRDLVVLTVLDASGGGRGVHGLGGLGSAGVVFRVGLLGGSGLGGSLGVKILLVDVDTSAEHC